MNLLLMLILYFFYVQVSISHDMNDETHSMSVPNGRHDVDNIFGIKRKRDGDKADFSTQDSAANTRTTNIDIRKTDASVTPNITVNIENVITYLYYIAKYRFDLKFYNMLS